ncbi:MAG: hypothetical protein QME14_02100 [Methanobacteriaceae archaeon]|nr:hypothetical protein [Methanobacteriaceae archaeon]
MKTIHYIKIHLKQKKALFYAISNSKSLDEFGKKVEKDNLYVKNAVALVKDQENAWRKLLEELKEFVRLKAPQKIFEIIDLSNQT